MIDLNKKLQDKANEIVNTAVLQSDQKLDDVLIDFMKGIVMLSLKQGFVYGVTSVKQVTEELLKNT